MRSALVTFFSSIGFAIAGYAMPLAFPKVGPWVAYGLLTVAGLSLMASLLLWLSSSKGVFEASMSQDGSGNNQFTGAIQAPVHVGNIHNYHAGDVGVFPAIEAGRQLKVARSSDERSRPPLVDKDAKPWHDGRTRFTIREIACLVEGIAPRQFESSDAAQSLANELRYFVYRGMVPIAGASELDRVARRASSQLDILVSEVLLDTYVARSDMDLFANPSLRCWLDVQDDSWRQHRS